MEGSDDIFPGVPDLEITRKNGPFYQSYDKLKKKWKNRYHTVVLVCTNTYEGEEAHIPAPEANMLHIVDGIYQEYKKAAKGNRVVFLVLHNKTSRIFRKALTNLVAMTKEPNGPKQIVVFFSGHGGQVVDDNGDEEENMDEILLFKNNWYIRDDLLRKILGRKDPEAQVVLIASCCHSATAWDVKDLQGAISIGACEDDDTAWGNRDGSYFVRALVKIWRDVGLFNMPAQKFADLVNDFVPERYNQESKISGTLRDAPMFSKPE